MFREVGLVMEFDNALNVPFQTAIHPEAGYFRIAWRKPILQHTSGPRPLDYGQGDIARKVATKALSGAQDSALTQKILTQLGNTSLFGLTRLFMRRLPLKSGGMPKGAYRIGLAKKRC
jgi:hypothetical protein